MLFVRPSRSSSAAFVSRNDFVRRCLFIVLVGCCLEARCCGYGQFVAALTPQHLSHHWMLVVCFLALCAVCPFFEFTCCMPFVSFTLLVSVHVSPFFGRCLTFCRVSFLFRFFSLNMTSPQTSTESQVATSSQQV